MTRCLRRLADLDGQLTVLHQSRQQAQAETVSDNRDGIVAQFDAWMRVKQADREQVAARLERLRCDVPEQMPTGKIRAQRVNNERRRG